MHQPDNASIHIIIHHIFWLHVLQYIYVYPLSSQVSTFINTFCSLPIAVVDFIILLWITISFLDSGNEMIAKRQDVKAFIIHKLSDIMSMAVIFGIVDTVIIM